jgi:hypothetical protein
MAPRRLLVHSTFLMLLPIAVALFGVSTLAATVLVLVALVWRLAITASFLVAPPDIPDLELETIGVSHFVEKVRWCMDRLGVDYVETQAAGIIGLVSTGRTVPRLLVRTGRVRSAIGNSTEILRYLYGAYAPTLGEKAAFLEATEEHLELEKRIDRYGFDLQVWIYYHVLTDRSLSLDVWGRNSPTLPNWQRHLIVVAFPMLRSFLRRAFQLSESSHRGAVERIEAFLDDTESRLSDGRRSLLGRDAVDYVDISLASISALWLQPEEFGAGKADSIRVALDRFPPEVIAQVGRWTEQYPVTVAFVRALYRSERLRA